MALFNRATSGMPSAFQPGRGSGAVSGLHSARSPYLAVPSSPSAWSSTKTNRQKASLAQRIPQLD